MCFGSVRVLVPCGAGDLLVRDLIREATLRYKKATGQVSGLLVFLLVHITYSKHSLHRSKSKSLFIRKVNENLFTDLKYVFYYQD